jgi:predicted AlkP superfamily pyrophosphatase or phosphodiesterase
MYNENSLDTLCGALAYAMGIEPPALAAEKNAALSEFIDRVFDGGKADRVVMYNPDAIAAWIYEKYPYFCRAMEKWADVKLPLLSVMPSVTPVCFGTMYTGAQPSVHGIQKYEKPVITIDTLFDALIRAGKKVAFATYGKCSLSRIYLERDIAYYHFEEGPIEQVNAKAMELILKDEYDFILIYNGNYDSKMHKFGPEGIEALSQLTTNSQTFAMLNRLVSHHWTGHNTLVGFAMDHGCHEIDGNCGSHGLDMPEDLNIVHHYVAYPAAQ